MYRVAILTYNFDKPCYCNFFFLLQMKCYWNGKVMWCSSSDLSFWQNQGTNIYINHDKASWCCNKMYGTKSSRPALTSCRSVWNPRLPQKICRSNHMISFLYLSVTFVLISCHKSNVRQWGRKDSASKTTCCFPKRQIQSLSEPPTSALSTPERNIFFNL